MMGLVKLLGKYGWTPWGVLVPKETFSSAGVAAQLETLGVPIHKMLV